MNDDLFVFYLEKIAFYTVDHVILLTKLRFCGVETRTINWLSTYCIKEIDNKNVMLMVSPPL